MAKSTWDTQVQKDKQVLIFVKLFLPQRHMDNQRTYRTYDMRMSAVYLTRAGDGYIGHLYSG